jgi:hypothetical protein
LAVGHRWFVIIAGRLAIGNLDGCGGAES